ncbi:DeoR/GlpR family DNA-binding transcription regulator [Oceanibium sediminis]|uniref:DeoR/GlpR family DNA-binding transcription regulator n=1 Tax=Oceanibium sediminis TaxID=2026339 RepID=UPI000DD3E7D4|nr:DeoR/GlpR family DNA-binding transcription regulator [Oceanibium sediminis]
MTARRYKKQERHEHILLELRLKPHVRVADLAKQFGVTTETVRRDIEDLGRDGLVQRAHGGASMRAPGTHRDLDERRLERVAERERLGRFAASLVVEGSSIMVDAGTTTMEFARSLAFAQTRVTVITNSLQVAMILGQNPAAEVRLTPGEYLPREAALIGTETCEYLAGYNVDACFIGAAGFSEAGVTEAITGFGAVKRAMMRQSRARFVLVDASKFGQTHISQVARLEEIGCLVSDRPPTVPLAGLLRKHGTECRFPEPDEAPPPRRSADA